MPAPLAKGLILATTLLLAASISLYENPQVREWIEAGRQKIVLAFNGQGGVEVVDLDTEKNEEGGVGDNDDDDDKKKKDLRDKERRDRIIRQNLYRHGLAGVAEGEKQKRLNRGGSFDDFLTSEGHLRDVSPLPSSRTRGIEIVEEKDLLSFDDTAHSTAVRSGALSSGLESAAASTYQRRPIAPDNSTIQQQQQQSNRGEGDVVFPSTLSALLHSTTTTAPQDPMPRSRRGDQTPTTLSPSTLSPISRSQDLLDLQDQESLERSISEWEEGFMSSSAASAAASVSADGEVISRTMSRAGSRGDDSEVERASAAAVGGMSDCGSEADWVSDAGIHTPGSWMSVGGGSSVAGEGEELGLRR